MNSDSKSGPGRNAEEAFLWCGILGPPVIWLCQFELNYLLVPWVCSTGHTLVLHVASLVFFAGALALGIAVWRKREQLAGAPVEDDRRTVSCRFMARVGVWSAALFCLAIAAQAVAGFIVDPCAR